jgi:hypothetical protein
MRGVELQPDVEVRVSVESITTSHSSAVRLP